MGAASSGMQIPTFQMDPGDGGHTGFYISLAVDDTDGIVQRFRFGRGEGSHEGSSPGLGIRLTHGHDSSLVNFVKIESGPTVGMNVHQSGKDVFASAINSFGVCGRNVGSNLRNHAVCGENVRHNKLTVSSGINCAAGKKYLHLTTSSFRNVYDKNILLYR